jgi:hypothetical protein
VSALASPIAPTIDKHNVKYNPKAKVYDFDDDAMLKLILDDTEETDSWMNINQWASRWVESDALLQSPTSSFDGIARMSVPKFTLSNTLATLTSKIMLGLFYDDPPFILRARPGTDPEMITAKEALFAYQFDEMKFMEECEAGWEMGGLLGTMIFKWGFCKKKKYVPSYKAKANPVPVNTAYRTEQVHTPDSMEFEEEIEEKDVAHPWFKACDIRNVLVCKGTRRGDIRKAKFVIYRDYPTWEDLEDLRQEEGYDIPDRETLEQFFLERAGTTPGDNLTLTLPENMRGYLQHAVPRNYKQTADPFENGIELLERVDKNKKGVALCFGGQHSILIYNGPNEYGKVNYLSCNWRNLPDAFYGQGLGQLIGSEQMVEQGTQALALGLLAYALQPTFIRKKGFNAISQPTIWEQGGVIDVEDDVDKAFKIAEIPHIPPEAWQMIAYSQSSAAETSGANQQTTMGAGASGIKTTGMRSGTGAALVGQASASRLDGPVERFIRQVFVPWLYEMDTLNNKMLPTQILNEVLGEEIGKEFKVDHIKFRNAKIEYDVLAGAHLGSKKEMSQFLPFVMQLVNNPTLMEMAAEQGLQFNFKAWFEQFSHLAGYAFTQNFFIPATAQQQQKRMANSPAGVVQIKAQAAQRAQVQKFQQEQQLLDQEQLGKGANESQRIILEHVLDQGIEGGEGTFGTAEQ